MGVLIINKNTFEGGRLYWEDANLNHSNYQRFQDLNILFFTWLKKGQLIHKNFSTHVNGMLLALSPT